MKKSIFTIRKKKREDHPQIIIGADKTTFDSVSLTHSKGAGKHSNIPLPDNPDKKDLRPSYFARKIINDLKFRYSKQFKNYKLTDDDISVIIAFLKRKK